MDHARPFPDEHRLDLPSRGLGDWLLDIEIGSRRRYEEVAVTIVVADPRLLEQVPSAWRQNLGSQQGHHVRICPLRKVAKEVVELPHRFAHIARIDALLDFDD